MKVGRTELLFRLVREEVSSDELEIGIRLGFHGFCFQSCCKRTEEVQLRWHSRGKHQRKTRWNRYLGG